MVQFQIAMSAAIPPDHGAHLAPPTTRVDDDPKKHLRRKREPNCVISKNKTPAERTAGAACDVVDTRSDIASKKLYSIFPTQEKALAKKQPETRAKFADTHPSRGASVGLSLSLVTTGTTPRNAWLIGRFYRVLPNLLVEVLP